MKALQILIDQCEFCSVPALWNHCAGQIGDRDPDAGKRPDEVGIATTQCLDVIKRCENSFGLAFQLEAGAECHQKRRGGGQFRRVAGKLQGVGNVAQGLVVKRAELLFGAVESDKGNGPDNHDHDKKQADGGKQQRADAGLAEPGRAHGPSACRTKMYPCARRVCR